MSECIKALIVDDEELGRTNLRLALASFPSWHVLGECPSAESAREALKSAAVDVIFLDIRMPHESGLGLAKSLSQLEEPPLIIFVTAFENYAVAAFEVHALDYLLKPFDDQRLGQALERAELMLQLRQRRAYGSALREYVTAVENKQQGAEQIYLKRISVRSTGRIELVELDAVTWIGSAGNYVELHLGTKTLLHRVPLSQLEKQLDPSIFIRVHRSFLVRRSQMSRLSVTGDGTYELELKDGGRVAVSERHIQAVRNLMG